MSCLPGLPAGQTECEAAGCCWDGDSTCYHRLPARRYTARLAGAGGNQVGRQLTTRYTGVQSWGEVEVPDLLGESSAAPVQGEYRVARLGPAHLAFTLGQPGGTGPGDGGGDGEGEEAVQARLGCPGRQR